MIKGPSQMRRPLGPSGLDKNRIRSTGYRERASFCNCGRPAGSWCTCGRPTDVCHSVGVAGRRETAAEGLPTQLERHHVFLTLSEDVVRHGGEICYCIVWKASDALHVKPGTVYSELRRYWRQALDQFLFMCDGAEQELTSWLKAEALRGSDLVEAYERFHSVRHRNGPLAGLVSAPIPFIVYLAFVEGHRDDLDLSSLLARTAIRQPAQVRKDELNAVNAEQLFLTATDPTSFEQWTAAASDSPVHPRPGWGSPITVSYDDGSSRRRGEIAGTVRANSSEVSVRLVLTPTQAGTRLEMMVEDRSIRSDARPARRKAELVEWWFEVVLYHLLELHHNSGGVEVDGRAIVRRHF